MPTETNIGWTSTVNPDGTISPGFSSNPIKYRNNETGKAAWACVKKSAGCSNCYAEALALRWNKGQAFSRPNIDKVTPFLDEKELRRLGNDPKLSGKKVFVGDMTDIFGSWVPDEFLARLFDTFASRKDVIFQVLTKRPERAAALLGSVRFPCEVRPTGHLDWPLPNVWVGTSTEDQQRADERIPHLLHVPAAVRFLSMEPLLGPVEFSDVTNRSDAVQQLGKKALDGISWVIVGGESGVRHRPMKLDWLNSIVAQCHEAGVPVFTKQDSGMYPGRQGRIPDDLFLHQFPVSPAAAALVTP